MNDLQLQKRLTEAVGKRTFRSISTLTGVHQETVRRYMQGQTPSAEFITRVCETLDVNADWLLTGRGAMRIDDIKRQMLREADAVDLLTGLAGSVQILIERIERLEVYVQTLDTRLRGLPARLGSGEGDDRRRTSESGSEKAIGDGVVSAGDEHGAVDSGDGAAGRIQRALAERPPADDDGAAPPAGA